MATLRPTLSRKGTSKWLHETELQAAALASPAPLPTLDEWGFPIDDAAQAPTSAIPADEYADDTFEPLAGDHPAAPSTHTPPSTSTSPLPSDVVHACVAQYVDDLATDTARNVIIVRAIANNRKVMMHRVQSSVMREEPNTQPMNGQRDVVNNELDDAGEPVDMWTAIRDLQNRDIPQPPATSTPTPLQNTTATQPTQPQPTAPTKPTTTRPRTSKLLKRAHTQVDPMVGVQQQHTRAPTAGPPPHASLQHAESDAAGINPAWLGGAGGGAQHAQHGGGQVGGRGHGHGRGVGRGGGSAPPTSSKTCIKPPMQLTFPIQPPARHCRPLDATARLLQLFSPDDLLVRKLLAVCPPSRPPSPGVSYQLEHVARPAPNSLKRRTLERRIAEQNLQLYNRLVRVAPSRHVDRKVHAAHYRAHCTYQHNISEFEPPVRADCVVCRSRGVGGCTLHD